MREHFISTDDVVYFGVETSRTWRVWEIKGVNRVAVSSILFVERASKTKKAKYLYLSRGTELEAQAVDDMVEWAQKADLGKGRPVCIQA